MQATLLLQASEERRRHGEHHKDFESGVQGRQNMNFGLPFPSELISGAFVLAVTRHHVAGSDSDAVVLNGPEYDDEDDDESALDAQHRNLTTRIAQSCVMIDILRSAGVPIDANYRLPADVPGGLGLSALQVAASCLANTELPRELDTQAHLAVVEKLTELGADVNLKVVKSSAASDSNGTEMARRKQPITPQPRQSSEKPRQNFAEVVDGDTPLMIALRSKRDEMAFVLLAKGADLVRVAVQH